MLGNVDAVLTEANEEFLGIDLAIAVVGVEELEALGEAADCVGTSGGQLCAHLVQYYNKDLLGLWCDLQSWTLEDCIVEFG